MSSAFVENPRQRKRTAGSFSFKDGQPEKRHLWKRRPLSFSLTVRNGLMGVRERERFSFSFLKTSLVKKNGVFVFADDVVRTGLKGKGGPP